MGDPTPAGKAEPQLEWLRGDSMRTVFGTYALQSEHTRGEPPYFVLLWWARGAACVVLGDSREKNAKNWSTAGTRRECKALAREHHAKLCAEAATV